MSSSSSPRHNHSRINSPITIGASGTGSTTGKTEKEVSSQDAALNRRVSYPIDTTASGTTPDSAEPIAQLLSTSATTSATTAINMSIQAGGGAGSQRGGGSSSSPARGSSTARINSPPVDAEWNDTPTPSTTTSTSQPNRPQTASSSSTVPSGSGASTASASAAGSRALSPTPSQMSSAAFASASSKRKAMVAQFIRAGESNTMFREKAPSILPNDVGIFYAPPSAMSNARREAMEKVERERERERERETAAGMVSDRGYMPIPMSGLGAYRDSSTVAQSMSPSSPRRTTMQLSSSPMGGMNSRQLLFQLGQSSGSSPLSVTNMPQQERQRRGSGNLGIGTRSRADSRSDNEDVASPRGISRWNPFSSTNKEKEKESAAARAVSPRPPSAIHRAMSPHLRAGTPDMHTARHSARGHTRRQTGMQASESDVEESRRRRADEREVNILAPFLEARGEEDFVTYDLTRQQDYHKQRKEMTKERFKKWTKEQYRAGKSKREQEEEDEEHEAENEVINRKVRQKLIKKRQTKSQRNVVGGGGSSDEDSPPDTPSSSGSSGSDADESDYDSDGETIPVSAHSNRYVHMLLNNRFTHLIVKVFMLGQSWIICALIGMFTGLFAALVDLAVQWLTDLKSGYCSDAFYLSNSFCCAASTRAGDGQPMLMACEQWVPWDSSRILSPTLSSLVSPFFGAYVMYTILGILMSTLSAWLVLYYAPHAAGSGIPEIKTILGGVVVKKYLGGWTLLTKCIALCLSVGSGLSLGKEGGYIHISCCIANILSRYFPEFKQNQYKKNEAISAAAAAGISVAFGAPVGGVLFCLEEISSFFPHKTMWRSFFCAIISSLVLQSIDPYQEGRLTLFQIDYNKTWYWFELLPFILIGASGGLGGALFIKWNTKLAEMRKNSQYVKNYPIVEVAVVTLFTCILKYLSVFMRGNQNSVLAALFDDCQGPTAFDPLRMCDPDGVSDTIASLIMLSGCTFILTTFTWSLCIPGGVFVPALIMGASYGRIVGTIMRTWQSSSHAISLFEGTNDFTPGIYALVGAASFLGGVTRMTISLVVIMFELTGGVTYLLPIMISVMFSKLVGDAFSRRSIFESHLILNQYPFLNNKDRINPKTRVSDAMTRDLLVLPMHGHTVESLTDQLALLGELHITGFPIVTTLKDRFIVGYINRSELYTALCMALRNPSITPQTRCYFAMLSLRFPRNDAYVDLRPWLHPSPIQVVEHTPLYRVHDMFKKLGLRYCLVTNFGKLTGILTKKDLLSSINTQLIEEKRKKKKQNENRNGAGSDRKSSDDANSMKPFNVADAPDDGQPTSSYEYQRMAE